MKLRKQYVVLLLIFALFVLLPSPKAVASEASAQKTGLERPTLKKMDSLKTTDLYQSKRSAFETSEWEQYGTYYYYNQMTSKEQAFYDRLNAMCLSYIEGTSNAKTTYYNYEKISHTSFCSALGLSENSAYDIAMIFFYSNPQYYFLSPTFYIDYIGDTPHIAIQIYDSLAKGKARKKVTASIKAKIDSYVATIEKQNGVLAKEKKAHDLITNHVIYEATDYDQSAYSAFLQGKTVCAGYAAAFSILCNAVGIDTAVVTSYDHAWNYIRLNDSWYYVDCTWDDTDDDSKDNSIYTYFNRSENQLIANSGRKASHHIEESLWRDYIPACTLDSGASKHRIGTIYTPTKKTSKPSISITKKNGYNSVAIKVASSNAIIYYTTDGSTPSAATGKAIRYHSTFKITRSSTIKAIAVSNTHYDSSVTANSQVVTLSSAYTPAIVTQPASASYAYQTKVKALTVKATVSDGGSLSYQWYQAKKANSESGVPIANATASSYTPSTSAIGTMYYYCVVTNTNENATKKKTAVTTTSAAKVITTKRSLSKATTSKLKAASYTGKKIAPQPTVKWQGTKLVNKTDYTLSYSSNKAVGTATVTITGKGVYNGSKKVTFSIVPKTIKIRSVSAKSRTIKLAWKKDSSVSGYQIQYSTKKNFSTASKVTVKKASMSTQTISKLKGKKGYYLRIRGYKTIKNKTYYSNWSETSYIKTK